MNSIIEKLKIDFKWAMASRASILMLSVSFIIYDILYPALIYGIYQKYRIPGWDVSQILFMYGIFLIVLGTNELFLNSFRWEFLDVLRSGHLDYWLVRPKSILKMRGISLFIPSLNDVVAGIIITTLFFQHGNLLNLIILSISGILFLESFNLWIVSFSIKYISVNNLWYVGQNFMDASHWPIKIFPNWIKIFILTIPFVLISYGPTYAYLFNDTGKFSISIISSIILFISSIIYFKHSLKKYSSAGG